MAANIKTLVDGAGEQVLPRTRAKAVMTEGGVTAEAKFEEITGELGGISSTVAKARPNITGTYPVAEGQTISAGDVVDVQSGCVTKAGTPSQCVALQGGEAGREIEVIFDGVAELPGAAEGREITSSGVYGYCPKDGWLWVRPEWDARFVTGSYVGTGNRGPSYPNKIVFPSAPKCFFLQGDGANGESGIYGGAFIPYGIQTMKFGGNGNCTFSWSGNTVTWWYSEDYVNNNGQYQANAAGKKYDWIALF